MLEKDVTKFITLRAKNVFDRKHMHTVCMMRIEMHYA